MPGGGRDARRLDRGARPRMDREDDRQRRARRRRGAAIASASSGAVDERGPVQRDDDVARRARAPVRAQAVGRVAIGRIATSVSIIVLPTKWMRCVGRAPRAAGCSRASGECDEEQVGDRVGDDAVDLLGHRAVEAAQARLDVADRDAELRGHERGGERRVDVAGHEHDVGLGVERDRLEALHHARRLLARASPSRRRACGRARRRRAPRRRSRDIACVVVLAGVDEHVLELVGRAAARRRSARSS